MKYRLFTVADPSDSKKIGSSDTVNFLPEINKQNQLCWRSRPGLYGGMGGGGWNFSTGGAPPEGCTHNVTMANLPGFKGWDVVDNETGNYSCTPAPTDAYEFILNTTFSAGTKKTCYFIIRFTNVSVGEYGWTLYLDIQNGYGEWPTFTPFPGYPMGYVPPSISTLCYVNIPDNATSLFFDTGNPLRDPSPPTEGSVFIECIMIVDRDWVAAGEDAAIIYDENGDIII